jgi:hypothetical protein
MCVIIKPLSNTTWWTMSDHYSASKQFISKNSKQKRKNRNFRDFDDDARPLTLSLCQKYLLMLF